MRTYSEQELLKAIEYACSYQKATDYQTAGRLLIVDEAELNENKIKLLDDLADSDANAHSEITIDEINEYLDEE